MQESTYKGQLTSLENQFHDAWINLKQTERKLEEQKNECVILRKRLSTLASQRLFKESTSNQLHNIFLLRVLSTISGPSLIQV